MSADGEICFGESYKDYAATILNKPKKSYPLPSDLVGFRYSVKVAPK